MKKKRGFTLVELIIVIAVIGVLAAILIPVFANVISKANAKSALTDAKNALTQTSELFLSDTSCTMPDSALFLVKKADRIYAYNYTKSSGGLTINKSTDNLTNYDDFEDAIFDYGASFATEVTKNIDAPAGTRAFVSSDVNAFVIYPIEQVGSFTIKGDSTGYSLAGGVLTISAAGNYAIANVNKSVATTERIVITAATGKVNLLLNGLNIKTSGCPIDCYAATDTTITLANGSTNTLAVETGPITFAGIKSTQNHTLTITGDTGRLAVTGGRYGAGIGTSLGDGSEIANNITISGGIITATGGNNGGAGIGGSRECSASNITITGGTVTAKSVSGAGIGSGLEGMIASDITISGGTVICESSNGAGVGGGSTSPALDIRITGGNVTATGGYNSPGIGGGGYETTKNISISGGIITAKGGNSGSYGGAGIGAEYGCIASDIRITGGTVTAIGGPNSNGIGSGSEGSVSNVVVAGGSVHATGALGAIGCTPTDGKGNNVFLTVFTATGTANLPVTVTNAPSGFGTKDMYSDADSKVYLYLPTGATSIVVETAL